MPILEQYAKVAGVDVIQHLRQLSEPLKGMRLVHINSTREGGGVAEILYKMVPLMRELGIDASWEVITGEPDYYVCTKSFHNGMQGAKVQIPQKLLRVYERTNAEAAEALAQRLHEAQVVLVHDPQPAAMIRNSGNRNALWIWRCHIDVSRPFRPTWAYLRSFVADYDASVFSLPAFAQPLPHPVYIIPPSIDPLHEKNIELAIEEVQSVCDRFEIDVSRPLIVQVSRYDRFKDPLGVVQAYKLAKRFIPSLQLVLAGGGAADDPEGEMVLSEVRAAASDDRDIHVLLLPSDAHRTINAIQRAADIVLQKSVREGFGLTVTEAMWKRKPVVGGDTGGIRIQVINHHTGFLVETPEGAALRIRYLYHHRDLMLEMGEKARRLVRDYFLVTRHLREYLAMILALLHGEEERVVLK